MVFDDIPTPNDLASHVFDAILASFDANSSRRTDPDAALPSARGHERYP